MASTYTKKAIELLNTTPQSGKNISSDLKPNAIYIGEYLKSQGYTKAGTQAVLANINKESQFKPSIVEIGVGGSSAIGGKGGIGLIQWTGQKARNGGLLRRGLLEKAAGFNVETRDSLDFQTRYIVSEAKGKSISTILKTETDPVAACLELLFLDIRPQTAINFKKAVTDGKTPNSSDVSAVQARVNALWALQGVVDEIWGEEEEEEEEEVEEEEIVVTPPEEILVRGGDFAIGKDYKTVTSGSFSSSKTVNSENKEINGAEHLMKNLNNFVAFELYNLEFKDTGFVDNDNVFPFWVPLRVVLDIFNNYISIRDLTQKASKGTNTPGRKLVQFYTGDQDPDPTSREYFKISKFLTNENHFSIDPLKCVLPNGILKKQILLSNGKKVQFRRGWRDGGDGAPITSYDLGYIKKNGFHKNVRETLAEGKLMRGGTDDILNILVPCEYLKNELDKIVDVDKDTDQVEFDDMVTFIKTIVAGFNEALGSINDFDIHHDEQEDLFYVVDRKMTPSHNEQKPATKEIGAINLTGLNTTIKDLSVSSKISSRIGSMIAIAAQGTGANSKDSIGPMLEWNRGLLDRHIIAKDQKDVLAERKKAIIKEDERLQAWAELYYSYWEEFNGELSNDDGDYDAEVVSSLKQYHKVYTKRFVVEKITKTPKSKLPEPGVIPVELSFTMMGIGGFKIGQAFRVVPGVLPERYTDNFGFIVTGVTNNITDTGWTTEVKTQFYPIRNKGIEETKTKDNSEARIDIVTPEDDSAIDEVVGGDPAVFINPNKIGIIAPHKSTNPVLTARPEIKAWGDNAKSYSQADVLKGVQNGLFAGIGGLNTPGAEWKEGSSSNILGTYYLEATAAKKFKEWYNEMVGAGIKFRITSALRFGSNVGGGVHGYGLAVDFGNLWRIVNGSESAKKNKEARINNPVYKQMAEIGAKYGWYNPWRLSDDSGMAEIWHFEYWGPA